MKYRIWYSTESFADFIIDKTNLRDKDVSKRKIYESDANNPNNFHTLPDHIKKILYLDAPDLIVEVDSEPIFSIEISTEAGTGHNVFQRFARLAASAENNVPAIFIYPEAKIIDRDDNKDARWDKINPLIFKALDDVMNIHHFPALFYYYPTDYRSTINHANESSYLSSKGIIYDSDRLKYPACPDSNSNETKDMFSAINEIIKITNEKGVVKGRSSLIGNRVISERKSFMAREYIEKGGNSNMSPLTAIKKIKTEILLNHLKRYESLKYTIGELLRSREETIIYQANSKFREDPYAGALAAIDYLLCREGKTFEERKYNLVICWGKMELKHDSFNVISDKCSVNDFANQVLKSEDKNLLTKRYNELSVEQIPRYYMQTRYGSMFSKAKHIRIFSYFADAILFTDGALWRDA